MRHFWFFAHRHPVALFFMIWIICVSLIQITEAICGRKPGPGYSIELWAK